METKLNTWVRIIPWLIGFLLSTAGMFLGYNLGSDIASLLGGEPETWARLGKGFVWGGVISCPAMPNSSSSWRAPFAVYFRRCCWLYNRLSIWTIHPRLFHLQLGFTLDGILVVYYYIWFVSRCVTMVNNPSAIETRKPVDIAQSDRMDPYGCGLDKPRW